METTKAIALVVFSLYFYKLQIITVLQITMHLRQPQTNINGDKAQTDLRNSSDVLSLVSKCCFFQLTG